MEYILSIIIGTCKKHQYNSCKEFTELLDSRLPYNLFIMKLAGIVREMAEEARSADRSDDYEILEGIIGDLESSIEYDI